MTAETGRCPGCVARIASHAAVRMRQCGIVGGWIRGHNAVFVDELRAKRLRVEMHVAGYDRIDGLDDLPFLVFIRHRALKHLIAAPFESPHSPRRSQRIERPATLRSCGTRCDQRRLLPNRAVTIDAINFDGCSRLPVDFPVTVIVLREVAIIALHALFKMDVRKMNGLAEAIGIIKCDLLAVLVQPVPFSIVVENSPENPAVPMKICELCGLQLLVEFLAPNFLQELFVTPEPPDRRTFRVAFERLVALLLRGIALLLRIHLVAVDLVVPPGQPEIRRDHVRARMNVANHALARLNRARECVFAGMASLIFWDCWNGGSAETQMAKLRIGARVGGIAIVC